jgi:hypothetical protein
MAQPVFFSLLPFLVSDIGKHRNIDSGRTFLSNKAGKHLNSARPFRGESGLPGRLLINPAGPSPLA